MQIGDSVMHATLYHAHCNHDSVPKDAVLPSHASGKSWLSLDFLFAHRRTLRLLLIIFYTIAALLDEDGVEAEAVTGFGVQFLSVFVLPTSPSCYVVFIVVVVATLGSLCWLTQSYI